MNDETKHKIKNNEPAKESAPKDKELEPKVGRPPKNRQQSIVNRLNRKARIPLHEQKASKFSAIPTPGHVGRFVNDDGDRIQKFINAGWRIVNSENDPSTPETRSKWGHAIRRTINRGTGETVLMEIPKELYDEDQKQKSKKIDKIVNTIFSLEDSPQAKVFKKSAYGNLNININKDVDS